MNQWSRVSNQHGQTLLSLAFNFGVLSLMTLTFGIDRMNVVFEDRPRGCFKELSEQEQINRVMYHMLRDFKKGAKRIQLVEDERICYQVKHRAHVLAQLLCTLCTYAQAYPHNQIHTRTSDIYSITRTHVRTHARMHACTHALTHALTHARTHARTHTPSWHPSLTHTTYLTIFSRCCVGAG